MTWEEERKRGIATAEAWEDGMRAWEGEDFNAVTDAFERTLELWEGGGPAFIAGNAETFDRWTTCTVCLVLLAEEKRLPIAARAGAVRDRAHALRAGFGATGTAH